MLVSERSIPLERNGLGVGHPPLAARGVHPRTRGTAHAARPFQQAGFVLDCLVRPSVAGWRAQRPPGKQPAAPRRALHPSSNNEAPRKAQALDFRHSVHMLTIDAACFGQSWVLIMPRPPKPRVVCHSPEVVYFKPRGVPLCDLEEVVLGLDETEALRLADLEGYSQEEVGRRMQVSRATVGRILEAAHRKVAEALVGGKALRIIDHVPRQPLTAQPAKRASRPGRPGRKRGGRRKWS